MPPTNNKHKDVVSIACQVDYESIMVGRTLFEVQWETRTLLKSRKELVERKSHILSNIRMINDKLARQRTELAESKLALDRLENNSRVVMDRDSKTREKLATLSAASSELDSQIQRISTEIEEKKRTQAQLNISAAQLNEEIFSLEDESQVLAGAKANEVISQIAHQKRENELIDIEIEQLKTTITEICQGPIVREVESAILEIQELQKMGSLQISKKHEDTQKLLKSIASHCMYDRYEVLYHLQNMSCAGGL